MGAFHHGIKKIHAFQNDNVCARPMQIIMMHNPTTTLDDGIYLS